MGNKCPVEGLVAVVWKNRWYRHYRFTTPYWSSDEADELLLLTDRKLPYHFGGAAVGAGGGVIGEAEPGAESDIPLPPPATVAAKAGEAWRQNTARRSLSRMLRHMRRRRGLSQTAVAERMGSSQPAIARMESATGPWPSQQAIAAYAGACGHVALLGFLDVETSGDRAAARAEPETIAADIPGVREVTFISLGEPEGGAAAAPLHELGMNPGRLYELAVEPDPALAGAGAVQREQE